MPHRSRHRQTGSSPRGRGTLETGWFLYSQSRFIPARAGNTWLRATPGRRQSVHPRAGGEHHLRQLLRDLLGGSSPRGRGTPGPPVRFGLGQRFIPARAGNTGRPTSGSPGSTVHPRAGGEHALRAARKQVEHGSSPRGRGTRRRHDRTGRRTRFIPARAGNTRAGAGPRCGRPVHPRAGGEHLSHAESVVQKRGSSPRGRGTPVSTNRRQYRSRFIPARAGNTIKNITGCE